MLLGSFFTIEEQQLNGKEVNATLQVNAAHPIFQGHFPGQPVVPGVCMIQMIKELLEIVLAEQFQLKTAASLKYLSVLNPVENPEVKASFTCEPADGLVAVTGKLFRDETIFLKF